MKQAARAIIVYNNKLLLMRRNKQSGDYFTLVGGALKDGETPEQAVVREVHEESGLEIIATRLVYIEKHAAPYNEQFIFLCDIVPKEAIALQANSEEAQLNRLDFNIHEPVWKDSRSFANIPFMTPQLQAAIVKALASGFPTEPVTL